MIKRLVAAAVAFMAGPASGSDSNAAAYPGPWVEDFNKEITTVLAKNNITVCGEYYYRPHARFRHEYLVYCTRDGSSWRAFQVFTRTGKVLGPFIPPKDIPAPY